MLSSLPCPVISSCSPSSPPICMRICLAWGISVCIFAGVFPAGVVFILSTNIEFSLRASSRKRQLVHAVSELQPARSRSPNSNGLSFRNDSVCSGRLFQKGREDQSYKFRSNAAGVSDGSGVDGAGSENRTRTLLPEPDFESGASTSSATPAIYCRILKLSVMQGYRTGR